MSQSNVFEVINKALGAVKGDKCNYVTPFSDKCFSFKANANDSNYKPISICPNSIKTAVNDISLVQNDKNGFDSIISELPSVYVREYQFDARMQQIFNSFSAFARGLKNGFNAVVKGKDLKDKCLGAFQEIFTSIEGALSSVCTPSTDAMMLEDRNLLAYPNVEGPIFKIPFCLYYQIMSSKNTGKYVLPFNGSKIIDESVNSSQSWGGGGKSGASGTSSQSILGTILNFVGANVYIPFQPLWTGAGAGSPFPQIEIKFSLFNDTIKSAANNYMFVNNIMAKNKFMQYHIFQQNPCVYDIKVDGVGRFFMCSAKIDCTYKGVMRKIEDTLKGEIVKNRTAIYNAETFGNQVQYIPDVYEFSISFESLLPNNLNNHLFRFTTSKGPCETSELSGLGNNISKQVDNVVSTAQQNNNISED